MVHIVNEEPVFAEFDDMPDPKDQIVIIRNPRRRDGKELHYLDDDVTTIIIPWHRINFIQVLPSAGIEEIIGFVRE